MVVTMGITLGRAGRGYRMTGNQLPIDYVRGHQKECRLIDNGPPSRLRQKWERFHSENPHVMDAIHRVADEQRQAGYRRISMNRIFEILRADPRFFTDDKPWKLNNTYRSFYARELIRRDRRFDELIEVRS